MPDLNTLIERGKDALQKRNYDYARELLLQILAYDPNHGEARKNLYTAITQKYRELGAPSKLKIALLNTKTVGHLSLYKNNPQKRIEILQSYLLDDPTNAKMRTTLATSLQEAGYKDGAIAELEIATTIQPDHVVALKLLGVLYKEKGMVREAEEALQKVLQRAPEDREADKILRDISAVSALQKGIEHANSYRDILKDKDKAEELEQRHHLIKTEDDLLREADALQQELQKDPQNVKIVKKLGDLYFDRKKDYETARNWYQKAVQINSTDSALKNKADDCTIRLFDLQIEKLEKTNAPTLAGFKQNKLVFEIQSYERRVADMPTDMGLRFELAKRYYTAGHVDKAIAEFQQSVRDPKRKIDSHLYLGMCFKHKKMHDLAMNQFQKSLEGGLLTGDKPLLIRYQMACCSAEAHDYSRAITEGKKIMEIDINYKDISKLVSEWSQMTKSS